MNTRKPAQFQDALLEQLWLRMRLETVREVRVEAVIGPEKSRRTDDIYVDKAAFFNSLPRKQEMKDRIFCVNEDDFEKIDQVEDPDVRERLRDVVLMEILYDGNLQQYCKHIVSDKQRQSIM